MSSSKHSCIIIGAGICGLLAGRRLRDAGLKSTLLEQDLVAGGRVATVHRESPAAQGLITASYDTGAQFFTVREARFREPVDGWLGEGAAVEWSKGFATGDGSYYADGHPRYRGQPDMASLARYLAAGLDIRFNHPVVALEQVDEGWTVKLSDGSSFYSASLILTAPVPQSLELLGRGNFKIQASALIALEKISYDPCLALIIQLDGPSRLTEPGGLWPVGGPIDWIADNYQKRVSAQPGSMTIHAGPEFSYQFWGEDDEVISTLLLEAAETWINDEVVYLEVLRWPYSKPLWIHPEPFLLGNGSPPLIFAGDAFAGPRVEGAALSGLAAADYLLELFD